MQQVPVDNRTLDWPRRVANAINTLIAIVKRYDTMPFQVFGTAPAAPEEGQTYYDTTLHKVRTWDGTAWQTHW